MNYLIPNWPAPANIKAYTTLKQGWHSRGQDPTNASLIKLLSLPNQPVWLDQKHTSIAIESTDHCQMQVADALYTNKKNQLCSILTADCLPVLVTDKMGSQVAAIHAGWRGLAAGVIENTIRTFTAPPDQLLVWLGPAISQAKFEVGRDVFDAFTEQDSSAEAAFKPGAYEEKWYADLYALAKLRLKKLGIDAIYGGEYCTYSQSEMFYSYRREKENKGRLATLIWLTI